MFERQRPLNDRERQPGPVVCWISRDLRAEDHWDLALAQQDALEHKQPLLVVFCLQSAYLGALPRAFSFMLTGLSETKASLAEKNLPLMILEGPPQDMLPDFCRLASAGVVYCDFSPLRLARAWRSQLAEKLSIPLIEVDAHNVIPCWLASDHQEYGAYTFRPKVSRLLDRFLIAPPALLSHPFSLDSQTRLDLLRLDKREKLPLAPDSSNAQPQPGSRAAKAALQSFIRERLALFDRRNDPNERAASGLSPWLHFGQLAPLRAALDVRGPSAQQAAFLEELIVRRELSDNFCYYNPAYDQFAGFPSWAQATLLRHRGDLRPHLYSLDQLEAAQTADPLWNAAQRELSASGQMPGYLRMYWCKKILEWTPDPETAQAHAIFLNDRYFLDGRDPNGYAGIAWSIGGVHDRAWGERPVFGKVRQMTLAGCRRKFDVDRYIQSVDAAERNEHG